MTLAETKILAAYLDEVLTEGVSLPFITHSIPVFSEDPQGQQIVYLQFNEAEKHDTPCIAPIVRNLPPFALPHITIINDKPALEFF